MASLIPDIWAEIAEVVTNSPSGLLSHLVARGTSTEGVAIEVPVVVLALLDGDRMTHIELFDLAQRDAALARFEELSRSG